MQIELTLNEKKIVAEIAPDMLLIDFQRSRNCFSVKRGCETANCGLCTVFMDEKPVHRPQFAVSQPRLTLRQP